jgi:hypothetical protein
MNFLKHSSSLIEPPFIPQILYCYGELNSNIIKLQKMGGKIRTYHGTPSEESVQQAARMAGGKLLLVLDDLLEGIRSDFLDILFTRGSHNWGVSVVLVTQHLFNKQLRVPRANSHYIVLMRNPAGALQIRNLGIQLFPKHLPHFLESYEDATKEKFGYLVIDNHPNGEEDERLKTNIYPNEWPIYYVPKQ